jgi:hypothetical protein
MPHQQQRLLTPCGNISSERIEARQTPGTTAGTPAAGLLADALKLDLHNFNEGRSDSNYLWATAYRSATANMCYGIHGSPFLTPAKVSMLHISRQPWP